MENCYIVYSLGKCGSATLASRIKPNTSFNANFSVSPSEYFKHNVLHLHKYNTLQRVIVDLNRMGCSFSIIYPYRLNVIDQAISSFFQYLKNVYSRENSIVKSLLLDKNIKSHDDIQFDRDTIDLVNIFYEYLHSWLADSSPALHLRSFLRLMNCTEHINPLEVYTGEKSIYCFMPSVFIDRSTDLLTELTRGAYLNEQTYKNVSEKSRVSEVFSAVKRLVVLNDELKLMTYACYSDAFFSQLASPKDCNYL